MSAARAVSRTKSETIVITDGWYRRSRRSSRSFSVLSSCVTSPPEAERSVRTSSCRAVGCDGVNCCYWGTGHLLHLAQRERERARERGALLLLGLGLGLGLRLGLAGRPNRRGNPPCQPRHAHAIRSHVQAQGGGWCWAVADLPAPPLSPCGRTARRRFWYALAPSCPPPRLPLPPPLQNTTPGFWPAAVGTRREDLRMRTCEGGRER